MQFSYHWLKTRVNPDLSAEALANLLTMAGLEVEEDQAVAPPFNHVVVAEVKSVEKHPDADRLNITQVDVGSGENIQIVCGAPNVAVGIKVPCALPGAVLPGNFKIKPTKMRGQISNGMLCSGKELGLPEEVDGLMILPNDAPVGEDIRKTLDLDDALLTLKITPNRADCLSIKGIAREVAALTGSELLPMKIGKNPQDGNRTFPTIIDAPEDCGRLLTRIIEGVDAKCPTPDWMRQRLMRSGIRSINILVDIGNYVMLELGQPMHVFDFDKISGCLKARRAMAGETLLCLNEKTVTLNPDTLVIADEKSALSIAGLMGGESSAVDENTQNILLESAFFHPHIIAGKARQYGFGSDSSFRFERGVDYALQEEAIERASTLIQGICGGRIMPINHAQGRLPEKQPILVRTARIEKLLGITIKNEKINNILHSLALQPQPIKDDFSVTPPSFRFDIEKEIDIIEEIARVYGYDNIPDQYTAGRLFMNRLPETQKNRFDVYQAMAARDYQEVINYAFVDEAWENDFANNTQAIRLQNPIASQMSVMRSTLIGGLVDTLHSNLNRKHSRVRLFEIARVFTHGTDKQFVQNEHLAALAYGTVVPEQWGENKRKVDFYDIKADLLAILSDKKVQFQVASHPALHPGRSAKIISNQQEIGIIGELHPQWVQKYDLPGAPVLFEVHMSAVLTQQKSQYQANAKFPFVRRDLAFVLPEKMQAQELLDILAQTNHHLIHRINIFDIYRGQGLPENSKSLAVRITLQHQEKTLTETEVQEAINCILNTAKQANIELRV